MRDYMELYVYEVKEVDGQRKPNDPTLAPHLHAFSPNDRKDKNSSCWFCGRSREEHLKEVVINDGKREVKSVN